MMMRKHVLIVDDDASLASFVVETLSWASEDYRLSVARSGEEALERLHRGPVDLVITDLWMPGIDGLMLIRWLRAFRPRTPAILMTGDTRRDVRVRARRCGAWRTVPKSGDFLRQLERAVRDALAASGGRGDGQGSAGSAGPRDGKDPIR